MRTRVFLDTEFTGLHQNSNLISVGLVDEFHNRFYAEFTDYDKTQVNEWVELNVISKLLLSGNKQNSVDRSDIGAVKVHGDSEFIKAKLTEWIKEIGNMIIWSDCLAYDWVLFCQIFGGALSLPIEVMYIPMDLAVLFVVNGLDPDTDRAEFSGLSGKVHNALHDAMIQKACYEKLTSE